MVDTCTVQTYCYFYIKLNKLHIIIEKKLDKTELLNVSERPVSGDIRHNFTQDI